MKYAKIILFLTIAIACIFAIHFSGYLDLNYLQQHSRNLLSLVHAHYTIASLIFILLFMGTIFIGIPVTMPFCLMGGYLFGFWHSVLYSLISIMTGSITYFIIMRTVLLKTDAIANNVATNTSTHNNNNNNNSGNSTYNTRSPQCTNNDTDNNTNNETNNNIHNKTNVNAGIYAKYLQPFKESMRTHGIWYLLFLHFIHIVPYIVMNTLAVLAHVSLSTFALSTFFGAIPAVTIYSYTGQQITTLDSISDIWQPKIIFLFLGLIIFALLPILFRKRSLHT